MVKRPCHLVEHLLMAAAASTLALSAAAQQAADWVALPSPGPAKSTTYVVDPTHTFVMYEVGHYGTTTNRGRFSTRDGSIRIDADARSAAIDITMDMLTINSGVDALNRHLQSRDFFNVAAFPIARFVADAVPIAEGRITSVPGSLTLLGVTRPVALQARRFNCYISPVIRRQVCGGDFETTLKRSDFGITWGLAFGFEDSVRLLVQVEAVAMSPN